MANPMSESAAPLYIHHEREDEMANGDAGDHYRYSYRGIKIDPYRILWLYNITNPAQQHAVKKLLRAGRGRKTLREDVEEARMSLDRMLEMMDEDELMQKPEITTTDGLAEAWCSCGDRLKYAGRRHGSGHVEYVHDCPGCEKTYLLDKIYPTNDSAPENGAQEDV